MILYSVRLNLKKERFLKKRKCLCQHPRCSGWFIPQFEEQGNCQFDIQVNGLKQFQPFIEVELPTDYEVVHTPKKEVYDVKDWGVLSKFVVVATGIGSILFHDKDKNWNLQNETYALRHVYTHIAPNGVDIIEL
jgi:hypothetical protein